MKDLVAFGIVAIPISLLLGLQSRLGGVGRLEVSLTTLLVAIALSLVVLGAIALRNRPREHGAALNLIKGFAWAGLYFVLVVWVLGTFFTFRVMMNGESADVLAIRQLRVINTSQVTYEATFGNGFSPTLKTLSSPATSQSSGSCISADFIDRVLASGSKGGVQFIFRPAPPKRRTRDRLSSGGQDIYCHLTTV